MMEKTEKILKKKIVGAERILLLSHKGPDLDAFCSMLLIYKVLKDIFPQKDVVLKARQYPNFKLPLMKEVRVLEKEESINPEGEDLIIVTDSSEWRMCVEDQDTIHNSTAPVFFIDHHKTESTNREDAYYINEMRSSATEQVYVSLKRMFGKKFKLDKDVASLVQYGIVSDTGRFLFDLTTPETFRIFAEVVEVHRVDLEEFEYKSSKFPRESTEVIIEYLKTLTIEGDMSYMYISKDIIKKKNFKKQAVNEAYVFLKDRYLRFIQGVHWGFIVKPMFSDDERWIVSFRSTKGYQDVGKIARRLGGGGHTFSSAIKLRADGVDEVVGTVLEFAREVVSS
jgi:bifunctional oligoribonuclease and PAP phosphatase NrnA